MFLGDVSKDKNAVLTPKLLTFLSSTTTSVLCLLIVCGQDNI